MSHIVTIKSSFKSMEALKSAGETLGVPVKVAPEGGGVEETLYTGKVKGKASFQLKGWKYPVVVQEDGSSLADNYNGQWGKDDEMDRFSAEYGAQVATGHLRGKGYRLTTDRVVEDGVRELVFVS